MCIRDRYSPVWLLTDYLCLWNYLVIGIILTGKQMVTRMAFGVIIFNLATLFRQSHKTVLTIIDDLLTTLIRY